MNMVKTKTISISKVLSKDLILRDSANRFFDYIDTIPAKEIKIDFKDTESITASFAHQYCIRVKNASSKDITEIKVPTNIREIFMAIKHPVRKIRPADLTAIHPIQI